MTYSKVTFPRFRTFLFIIFISAIFASCSTSDPVDDNPDTGSSWTVPVKNIKGSLNPFPLAVNPKYSLAKNVDIDNNLLVAIVLIDDIIKVFPYEYIRSFEVINDSSNNINFAMTYCPITKSGICLNRDINNELLTMRASGYLYNENLVIYDEKSDSYWSQMLFKSIKGKFAEQSPNKITVIETTFETVKNYFPEALVFTSSSLSRDQNKLEDGDLVYGIINDLSGKEPIVSIFDYKDFGSEISIYQQIKGNNTLLIIGSEKHHFISSYSVDNNRVFSTIQNEFPLIMKDDLGNKWNIFGIAVSGPDQGTQLQSPKSFFALWWAWEAFYANFKFNREE